MEADEATVTTGGAATTATTAQQFSATGLQANRKLSNGNKIKTGLPKLFDEIES